MKRRAARAVAMARSGLARQVAEQAAVNIAIQGLGAITTFSFVRLLPTHEYAVFGLCLATIGFISVSSDLGLMASIRYFWRNREAEGLAFADRYAAIQRVRLLFFLVSAAIATTALAWLIGRQGVAPESIAVVVILALALSWSQISAAMAALSLRLTQQLRTANFAEIAGAVTRATLAVLAFVLAVREAWFPLLSLGVATLVTLALARRHVTAEFKSRGHPSRESIRSVARFIIPTTPATLIFATQDLFVYWLASFSGGALVVAQTFALGRLAAIFVTLNSIMANVVMPRVLNVTDDTHALRIGMMTMAMMAFFCTLLTGFAALFPEPLLWLLGKPYGDLQLPLVLSLITASVQVQSTSLGHLNRAMGWVRWETPMICIQVAVIVVLIPFFRFDTTIGVLSFNMLIAILWFLNLTAIHFLGKRSMRRAAAAEGRE